MNIYEPKSRLTVPVVEIDTTKPIVIFDPWPFAAGEVSLARGPHYFFDSLGKLNLRGDLSSAIHSPSTVSGASFLATATDGKPVIGKTLSLKRAGI